MSNIEQNLAFILSSRYGEDVRQAIHDAIHDCYEDGKAGSVDLVAREQIANLVANVPSGSEKDSELVDIRVGYNGTTYSSAGDAVRGQTATKLGMSLVTLPTNSDLNELSIGVDCLVDNRTYMNSPITRGFVITYQVSTLKHQIAIEFITGLTYHRSFYKAWSEWNSVTNDIANELSSKVSVISALEDGADINDAPINSITLLLDFRNYINAPFNSGYICTISIGSFKRQMGYEYTSNNIYFRNFYGSWTPWKKMLFNPSISVIGDSISDFTGFSDCDIAHTSYYPRFNVVNNTDMYYSQVASNIGGAVVKCDSYSGTCISYRTIEAENKAKSFIERAKTLPCSNIMLVEGGTNDSELNVPVGEYIYSEWTDDDLTTYRPALAYLLNYLKQKCAGSQIIYLCNKAMKTDYKDSAAVICEYYDVPIIYFEHGEGTVHLAKSQMTALANQIVETIGGIKYDNV